MAEQMRLRILVFEYHDGLASAIRDVLELENYLALPTTEAHEAMLVLDSFCPDIVILGYYIAGTKDYAALLERCQLNYPILYLCSPYLMERLRYEPFLSSLDRILEKPFDCAEMMEMIEELAPQ